MPVTRAALTALIISWFSTLAAGAPVTDGLVSYWTFDADDIKDGVVMDIWGGNHGDIVGDPEVVAGRDGSALWMDGVDDAVDYGAPESLTSILDAVTLEAWVKDDGDGGMIAGFSRAGNSTWMMGMDLSGHIIFDLWDGAVQVWPHVSAEAIERGEWHHLVGVYDGDEAQIYIDGELNLVQLFPGDLVYNNERFQVGRRGGGDKPLRFTIDDLRVYDRALNEDEIRQDLLASGGLHVQPGGKLITAWGRLRSTR